jgi:serine O-acetyltransferase
MGTVIGETAEIGDDRHHVPGHHPGRHLAPVNSDCPAEQEAPPDLRDRVIVGGGAQILGAIVVGPAPRSAPNAVVVSDVAGRALMVGIPPRSRAARGRRRRFRGYGLPNGVLPDPVTRAIEGLMDQVSRCRHASPCWKAN